MPLDDINKGFDLMHEGKSIRYWSGTSLMEVPGAPGAVPQLRVASEADYLALEKWIEENDPPLEEIDQRIEQMGPLVDVPVS
jgi:hypothetical protein